MFQSKKRSDEGSWISLSDMMTVLMVLFLIISVTIAVTATTRLTEVRQVLSFIANEEQNLCDKLKQDLSSRFTKNDLTVECNPIRVIFTNPDYKFAKNSSNLTSEFKRALAVFFPIYLGTVENWKLKELVDEIRIEGHTDSDGPYIYNMRLSQERAREVLSFGLMLREINKTQEYKLWSQSILTANGLSFSRRLSEDGKIMKYPSKGVEDKDKSRRVEVKLRTNSKEVLIALQKKF